MSGPASGGPVGSEVIPDRRFVTGMFTGLAPRYNGVLQAYSLGQDLRWKRELLRRLHLERGQRALDLACGTGLVLDRLAKVLGDANVLGADINRTMLLQMRRARVPHPAIQSNAEHLPLDSNTFDVVTAGYLLKYVHLERFFREVARVLKPGGRFAGYDFSRPVSGTLAGKLYSWYLHRVMPWMGRGRNGPNASWRVVFDFLPHVAESSGWEARVPNALDVTGFVEAELRPSLGGAITWVWARKPPR